MGQETETTNPGELSAALELL